MIAAGADLKNYIATRPIDFRCGHDGLAAKVQEVLTTRQHPCRAARQSLGEVATGDTLQAKDRKQRLDRFRAAHVGRQADASHSPRDRPREPDALGIGDGRLAIANTAGGRRPDRYRLSHPAPAGDRGGRRAGGPPQSSNRHACRGSLRPRPAAPAGHAPRCARFR